jgi:hypothetical protein
MGLDHFPGPHASSLRFATPPQLAAQAILTRAE